MADIQTKLKAFQEHTPERQKELVMIMLEGLKDANDNFHEVYERFQQINSPSTQLMSTIYTEVLELAQKTKDKESASQQWAFERSQAAMHAMMDKEAEEKKKDMEEAEALLDNL